MDNQEAIMRIRDHMRVHKIGTYPHIKIAEALNLAISSLQENRHSPKPEALTLDQLREMDGEPVWVFDRLNGRCHGWYLVDIENNIIRKKGVMWAIGDAEKFFRAYATKPEMEGTANGMC